MNPVPCIVCGFQPETAFPDGGTQPHGATSFQSEGQYGSTIFDPMNGEYLEINVCDSCLRARALEGRVLTSRLSVPVKTVVLIRKGVQVLSIVGYQRVHASMRRWHPDDEASHDFIEVHPSEVGKPHSDIRWLVGG